MAKTKKVAQVKEVAAPSSNSRNWAHSRRIIEIANTLNIPPHNLPYEKYIEQGGLITTKAAYVVARNQFFGKVSLANDWELRSVKQRQGQLERELGSFQYYLREAQRVAEIYEPVKMMPYIPKKHSIVERAVVVELSDWHIGANLMLEEAGIKFDAEAEARAVAIIANGIISYKRDHRDETRLVLVLLGDFIENMIHGISTADPVEIQEARAFDLLFQLLWHLSNHFVEIDIYCTGGNHDRDLLIHPKPGVRMRWANKATQIYANLAHVFSRCEKSNINFHITKKPNIEFELFGARYYGGHGDNFFKVPNPGKKLDMAAVELQTMRNNNKETREGRKPFDVFMTGHLHRPTVSYLNDGSCLVMNGPLIPVDMFAQSIGLQTARCGQMMFEAIPGHPVGDVRLIRVDYPLKDKSLDKIIKVNPIFEKLAE
jgi:predicted phosphodiesterase